MDALDADRDRIEKVLMEWVEFLNTDDMATCEPVFDRVRDRYLVVETGWEGHSRIYGVLLHIDIVDGKLWVQHNGTESAVADELAAVGIPKDRMVLGFRHPSQRSLSKFAAA